MTRHSQLFFPNRRHNAGRLVAGILLLAWMGFVSGWAAEQVDKAVRIESWVTTRNLAWKMAPQEPIAFQAAGQGGLAWQGPRVVIEEGRVYQTLLGLGSSLEGTTCSNFWRMKPADRRELMSALMDPEKGIGMNLIRVCMGTSDFTGDPWYSYCDLPAGQVDPELKHFSIARDRDYILPIVQLARRTNPNALFFASPWSPPGWMKDNGTMIGGKLLRQWYAAYADYFVKFVRAYEAEGIPIYAVTVQNEPGVDRAKAKDPKWHYPSCHWTGEEERDFIRDHLGPAFKRAGLKTRIWAYDHNYNEKPTEEDAGLDHPRTIVRDPKAAAFVGGVAFHGYTGDASGMSLFHGEFPGVPLHFSEGSVFGIQGGVDLIGRLRNWAMSYNAWVIMLDEKGRPNNGPFPATRAAVRLHSDTLKPEYLLEYYVYGHFMKFLPRGSVRLESRSEVSAPAQVVFRTPDEHVVMVAANPSKEDVVFEILSEHGVVRVKLSRESVGTWRW